MISQNPNQNRDKRAPVLSNCIQRDCLPIGPNQRCHQASSGKRKSGSIAGFRPFSTRQDTWRLHPHFHLVGDVAQTKNCESKRFSWFDKIVEYSISPHRKLGESGKRRKRSLQLGMENTGCIRLHHEYTPGAFKNVLLRQRCQLI